MDRISALSEAIYVVSKDPKLEHRTFNTGISAVSSKILPDRSWHSYIGELDPVGPEAKSTSYITYRVTVSLHFFFLT